MEDLLVFLAVVRQGSFVAAAEELGASPAYVTKRIKIVESIVGAPLFHRSTRRVVVTEDGERTFHWALKIREDADRLMEEITAKRSKPRGTLRICSSFGFGRNVVGPALADLIAQYPGMKIHFELFDRLVDINTEGFDLDIRVGDEIAPQYIARKIAANYRLICAAPEYLDRHGTPRFVNDLTHHQCIVIKERDHPFGLWRLRSGTKEHAVKVPAVLSTNHGEVAVQWAAAGMGVVLRSIWDVEHLIRQGKLISILSEWRQEANVWAVYPSRLETSAKVRVCVEWLQLKLAEVHHS